MKKIVLNSDTAVECKLSILIFTEGTIIGPGRLIDFYSPTKYVPIANYTDKIKKWNDNGAQIIYLTSRKSDSSVESIRSLLTKYGFPGVCLYYRTGADKYKDIVQSIKPDILIEDDCRSIGGSWQLCITHVEKKIRENIKSIVVKEFNGIDHLPDDLNELLNY